MKKQILYCLLLLFCSVGYMYGMEVDTQQDNQPGSYLELLPLNIQKAVLSYIYPKEEFDDGFIGGYGHCEKDSQEDPKLAFSPGSSYLASFGAGDGRVQSYDIKKRALVLYSEYVKKLLYPDGDQGSCLTEVYSPDRRYRLTFDDSEVTLYDSHLKKCIDMYSNSFTEGLVRGCFSPNSRYFVNTCGGKVQLCDLKNHSEITDLYSHSPQAAATACFSPDGNYIASGDWGEEGNKVKLYDFVKLLVARKRPEKFESFKEYLLCLDLNKGTLPKNIDQDEKNIFDAMPEGIKERFSVKRDRSSVLQLSRAGLSQQSDQNQE